VAWPAGFDKVAIRLTAFLSSAATPNASISNNLFEMGRSRPVAAPMFRQRLAALHPPLPHQTWSQRDTASLWATAAAIASRLCDGWILVSSRLP